MTVRNSALFKLRYLCGLALLVGLSLIACHGKPPQVASAPPSAPPNKPAADEPTKDLPADLYKGMPMYPGAVVTHVKKPRGAMREVVFDLKNPPPLNTMVAFYKDGLKAGNFKITSSLIMPARKTWSCDFHKEGRPGSVMIYPSDEDKTASTIDLIYEVASNIDPNLLEPKEDFDVIGPGPPGGVMPVANAGSTDSQANATSKKKAKRK